MAHTTKEMPSGTMDDPNATPSASSEPNMGDVFRATAQQSAQQGTPAVQVRTMPGEVAAPDEESDRTTGKMPGE